MSDWKARGACVGSVDVMFPKRASDQHNAAKTCELCPVIRECLAYALDTGQEFGVWGGQTERQRRALLKAHPRVTSWQTALVVDRVAG